MDDETMWELIWERQRQIPAGTPASGSAALSSSISAASSALACFVTDQVGRHAQRNSLVWRRNQSISFAMMLQEFAESCSDVPLRKTSQFNCGGAFLWISRFQRASRALRASASLGQAMNRCSALVELRAVLHRWQLMVPPYLA